MTKYKKLLTALILSAIIISSSGCEISQSVPAGNPSSESSSVSEISVPEEPEEPEISEPIIEEPVEAEPVIEPVFNLYSQTAEKGGYFIIKAENADLSEVVFKDLLGNDLRFFEKDGAWFSFIPVKAETRAGYYPLKISGEGFEFKTTLTVADRKLKTQYLVVEQATLEATLEDTAVREAFAEFVEEKRFNFTETPLWNGEFIKPLGDSWYKETTSYGTFRTFSSGRTEWHDATDMAVGGGTPVYATNSGKVFFADWVDLSGYTIIIDHGCGIMSWHYHLSSIEVSEGDEIEKGDFIGRVGTTGLSTGNHLHFGISASGTFVDPMKFVGTEPNLDFGEVKAE